ncbi:hypothetical protein E4H12_04740 [Candidatus Thorarchaeota archaeon]|nr:MAG: hypothetical protein E4H12_04740 [Candidatus Thorarchaeota archaeon]
MQPDKMSTKTQTLVVYPISSALRQAELFLKNVKGVTTANDIQKKFIDEIHAHCKEEISKIKEIESIANTNNKIINEWLKERGFQIKLEPFGPGGFGVASVLDLLGQWAIEGKEWSVETEDGKYYPGIKMNNYGNKFYHVKDNPNFIIEIETKDNDRVYLMMANEVPTGLSLLDYVEQLHKEKTTVPFQYDGFIFPKIDLDEETILEWILDLRFETPKGDIPYYVISQALQQTKLKMNEVGFRVKSAVALGILAGAAPKKLEPYVINRPFLLWIRRPGLSKPLFIAYLNKDVWKDPKGLDM